MAIASGGIEVSAPAGTSTGKVHYGAIAVLTPHRAAVCPSAAAIRLSASAPITGWRREAVGGAVGSGEDVDISPARAGTLNAGDTCYHACRK
ncbi:hypothetical protein KCP75_10195 [Salmonella enterica subsp. enterica]|nr:hypothetical protein KCP75_10195 [Salmonella enterica subsp. enterica]